MATVNKSMASGRSSYRSETSTRTAVEELLISPFNAGFTLLKCNWGIGMMTIPYMLDQGGVLAGLILFAASMAITQYSIVRLIEVKDRLVQLKGTAISSSRSVLEESDDEALPILPAPPGGYVSYDFTGIVQQVLGGKAEVVALLSIALSMWGSCVAYLIFIHDNMEGILGLPGDAWVGLSTAYLLVFAVLDDLRFLGPLSMVGLLCAFAFAAVLIYKASVENTHPLGHVLSDNIIDIKKVPLALSIAAFCNEGIVIISPSTHSSTSRPGIFCYVSAVTIIIFTCSYLSVGVAGNVLYAGDVNSDISKNFDDSTVFRVAKILYSAQLLPSFSVVFFAAYEALELKWCRARSIKRGGRSWGRYKVRVVAVRWVAVLIAAGCSLAIPKLGAYIGLIGALSTSLAIYVLPHLCWLKLCRVEGVRTVVCWATIVYGLVLAVVGSAQSAYELFK